MYYNKFTKTLKYTIYSDKDKVKIYNSINKNNDIYYLNKFKFF